MNDGNPDDQKSTKSKDAFRTISEVANELDLPQHVLRFWETKFPQVRPMKRGGGRRYYRPDDLQLLKRIRDLLYVDGYTIKGVQKLLRQSGSVRNFVNEVEGEHRSDENVPSDEKSSQDIPARASDHDVAKEIEAIVGELEVLREQLIRSAS